LGFSRLKKITLIVGASLALAACDVGEPLPKEPVKIRYQLYFTEAYAHTSTGRTYLDVIERFNATDPGFQVIPVYWPAEAKTISGQDFALSLIADDNPPDLIQFNPKDIPLAEEQGLLYDMMSLGTPEQWELPSNLLEQGMNAGRLLVWPYAANPLKVVYDKALYDRAGLPYPADDWTWEQYKADAQRISALGDRIMGSWILPYGIVGLDILLAGSGSGVLSPDGKTAVGFLDSQEAVRALEWLNGLYRDLGATPQSSDSFMGAYGEGTIGLRIADLDEALQIDQSEDNLGIAPWPHFEGGFPATPTRFQGYAIPRKSAHPKEAFDFLQNLVREPIAVNSNESGQLIFDWNEHARNFVSTSRKESDSAVVQEESLIAPFYEYTDRFQRPSSENNPVFEKAWNESLAAEFPTLFSLEGDRLRSKLRDIAAALDDRLREAHEALQK